jgi:hypothetical protein
MGTMRAPFRLPRQFIQEMAMSQAVHTRTGWLRSSSPEAAGAMAHTAATAEIAVRIAAGTVAVRVLTSLVRDHPLLSLLAACGAGYLIGQGWLSKPETTAAE